MEAQVLETQSIEKREKRARSIAGMGLVNREGGHFRVSTPSLRGRQTSYVVGRNEAGVIQCTCPEFEQAEAGFRCEHILAVKFALVDKNTEPVTKQPAASGVDPVNKSAAESRAEVRGEQEPEEVSEVKASERKRLANTKGEITMKRNNSQETVELDELENEEMVETQNNVLDFSTTLRELRKNVDPHLVKQREGWRDRNGNVQMVDYVEWHTVADILDDAAPNWAHTVKDIRQIGDIMTVTVAITIDGVTREGIGTGLAQSEMGIKKAEHDALKRAAVKFGIARDLYKKESDAIEREGSASPDNGGDDFPSNPIAKSLADLVTAKQLGMIRAISREIGVDPDETCESVMHCKTDELSKRAASALIQHLQDLQRNSETPNQMPARRAS